MALIAYLGHVMGDQNVTSISDTRSRQAFIRHLLDDIAALEHMVLDGMFESGKVRIGAEQEFCLITNDWRPAVSSQEILEKLNNPYFTTEIARYNLEANLDPIELNGNCFGQMESQLRGLLEKASVAAEAYYTKILLTGILPTVSKNELGLAYMSPGPRYAALNDQIRALRGTDFELRIRGVDELSVKHDTVLFEGCNTSFQMHLQIEPDDFINAYNWSQAISGPVLGICCNSPLLLGRELWAETRIALFQQSIDTRSYSYALKNQQARVTFGDSWAWGTIADIFKNDIARYSVLLSKEIEEDALSVMGSGEIPKLQALSLHNSTIYRWNRPCYGVGNGKPHLRIENRYIPAGPSVLDEMANFAFWVGLMQGRPVDRIDEQMDFRDVKSNFIKAARTGKESVMRWNGHLISVRDLVCKELLPIAYTGLKRCGVDQKDIERLLEVIEGRATTHTGAQWQIANYRAFRKELKQDDALRSLTRTIHHYQLQSLPVHRWPSNASCRPLASKPTLVGHIMSTQLFTVKENDLADLATNIMIWKNIHHVPVEDPQGHLSGVLTWTHIKRHQARQDSDMMTVSEIMEPDVKYVTQEATIVSAKETMDANEIGCLPVVHDGLLIGIITREDLKE